MALIACSALASLNACPVASVRNRWIMLSGFSPGAPRSIRTQLDVAYATPGTDLRASLVLVAVTWSIWPAWRSTEGSGPPWTNGPTQLPRS